MPLFQIGYRRYEGSRTPHLLRWLPITRTGLTIAWRSKLLRRLVYVSFVPFLTFALLFFLIGRATDPSSAGEFGGIVGSVIGSELATMLQEDPTQLRSAVWSVVFATFGVRGQLLIGALVAAIVGPSLISRDIRTRAFLIYFARPVSPLDYVIGKAGVLIGMLATVTLLPSLLLYVLSILFSPSIDTFIQTGPVALNMILASLGAIIPTTLIVLAISSLTSQPRFATAAWIILCIFGPLTHIILQQTPALGGNDWTFMLSLPHSISALQFGLYDVAGQVQDLGLKGDMDGVAAALTSDNSPLRAAIWLTSVSVLCTLLLLRRVVAPTRI